MPNDGSDGADEGSAWVAGREVGRHVGLLHADWVVGGRIVHPDARSLGLPAWPSTRSVALPLTGR